MNIGDIKVGQKALVRIPDLKQTLVGSVVRTSNALENQSRTLLAEVNVVNQGRTLLPGMYVQVGIETTQTRQLILVPGDTIVTRSEGIFVAVVGKDNKVTFRKIEVGRDFGTEIEAVSGLSEGDMVVVNPSDDVRDGVVVKSMTRK